MKLGGLSGFKFNFKPAYLFVGIGLYLIYDKFFKTRNTNYAPLLANQSTKSDIEIQSIIDLIINACNDYFGTDEVSLLDVISPLSKYDWAKVNKLFGIKSYDTFGFISTDYIDDLVFQSFDLLGILRIELSNNKDDEVYKKISQLYNQIGVIF